MFNDSADPIQDAITKAENQYTTFETGTKATDTQGLATKNSMWRSGGGNPFVAMMMWLNNVLISGDGAGIYKNQYSTIHGSFLDKDQDQISEAANGMTFLAAYRGASSDLGQKYSDAASSNPDANDLKDIQNDLSILANTTNLNFGSTDSKGVFHPVIDTGSQTQITSATTELTADFKKIADPTGPWKGNLSTFLADSTDKDDSTSAAALAQDITQQMPTITQATGLVSQTLQEQFGFIKADLQQYMAIWQSTMKDLTTVFTTSISNEKSGTT